ncbi:MAG: hypothetical protein ACJ754_01730 [Pyrinomonadaceae bacterium]
MDSKRKARPEAKGKPGAADLENLALLLAGVLAHPATPDALRQHIRYGLSEVFNNLDNNEAVTDSAEYITLLFAQHAEQSEGGAK